MLGIVHPLTVFAVIIKKNFCNQTKERRRNEWPALKALRFVFALQVSSNQLSRQLSNRISTICPYKVDILGKFKIFEFAALGGCGISKEITLLNLFCFCRPKYL